VSEDRVGYRDGSIGGREGSICENEICAFDLRAGGSRRVDRGYGYEKVKLIQFGARFDVDSCHES